VKKVLRIIAVILVVAATGFWLATGANRGWTKNKVEKRTLDEVTGIEGIAYEKKFVPGLDFLVEAAVGAGILTGASFFFQNKS
jgi:hypothetical protein